MIYIEPINNVFSKLVADDEETFRRVYNYFRIKDPSKEHTPRVKAGIDDGKTDFIKTNGQFLWGLKSKIIDYLERNDIEYKDNVPGVHEKIDDNEWNDFVSKLDLPFEPYDYQLNGARLIIEQKRVFGISATGSGKSYILYIVIRWFVYKNIKTMLVVPDVGLVHQMYSDMYEYYTEARGDEDKIIENRKHLNMKTNFDDYFHKIYAGQEKHTDHLCKITTFQSIYQLGPSGYFEDVEAILFDEAHRVGTADSYFKINEYTDAKYKAGVSGTMCPQLHDQLMLEGLIGESVSIITSRQLIDRGLATEVFIQPIYLEYSDETRKQFRTRDKKWTAQDKFIREHARRREFIKKLLLQLSKSGNTLALFKNKQIQKDLYKELKAVHSNTFIINGDVKGEERERIRKMIDGVPDAIIIATDKVLSTGINLKSLRNIVFALVNKAEIGAIQAIGRVIRLFDGKDHASVYDIVDDAAYTTKNGNTYDNYHLRHHFERLRAYHKYVYPVLSPKRIRIE